MREPKERGMLLFIQIAPFKGCCLTKSSLDQVRGTGGEVLSLSLFPHMLFEQMVVKIQARFCLFLHIKF